MLGDVGDVQHAAAVDGHPDRCVEDVWNGGDADERLEVGVGFERRVERRDGCARRCGGPGFGGAGRRWSRRRGGGFARRGGGRLGTRHGRQQREGGGNDDKFHWIVTVTWDGEACERGCTSTWKRCVAESY